MAPGTPGYRGSVCVLICVVAALLSVVSCADIRRRLPRDAGDESNTAEQTPTPARGNGTTSGLTAMLDALDKTYDSRIRPNNDGPPVIVATSIYVISGFSSVAATMDFNLMAFIRQEWNDPRLEYNGTANHSLSVNPQMVDKLWVPDMFFANEKEGKIHQLTVKNEALRIYPNGDVLLSMRVSLTLSCNMDLRYYPMDVQLCHLSMESYGFRVHDLLFHWKEDEGVDINDEIEIAEFRHPEIRTVEFNKTYATGSFTSLRLYFLLRRIYDFHLIQTYIPTSVIVVISWLSFWLNPESVPARVSLGITTLLTITSQAAGVRAGLPKVSYVKAIDVWMTTCLVFVFAALAEYALVNYLFTERKRRQVLREKAAEKPQSGSTGKDDIELESLNGTGRQQEEAGESSGNDTGDYYIATWIVENISPVKVDKGSRLVFPVLFVIFNVFYWPICLVSYNQNPLNAISIDAVGYA